MYNPNDYKMILNNIYIFKSYEKNTKINFVYLKRFMKYYFDDFELFIKLIGDLDDSSMTSYNKHIE